LWFICGFELDWSGKKNGTGGGSLPLLLSPLPERVVKEQDDPNSACPHEMYRLYLLELRPHVVVAHHLPGRLRVRVRPGLAAIRMLSRHAADGPDALHRLLPGHPAVHVNPLSGSLVLEYAPSLIPFELLDEFFRTGSDEQAAALLDRLLGSNLQPKETAL